MWLSVLGVGFTSAGEPGLSWRFRRGIHLPRLICSAAWPVGLLSVARSATKIGLPGDGTGSAAVGQFWRGWETQIRVDLVHARCNSDAWFIEKSCMDETFVPQYWMPMRFLIGVGIYCRRRKETFLKATKPCGQRTSQLGMTEVGEHMQYEDIGGDNMALGYQKMERGRVMVIRPRDS
ncbi:unnamed protein product [Cuscuta europaea]|uniref:Uncharacterized protein n=1 Tax=Cuscuta europaea TaxID=41803 RepID=A0A9P0YTY5_CUSEU|nr:unnamed protein product [Cuscuta europaea]